MITPYDGKPGAGGTLRPRVQRQTHWPMVVLAVLRETAFFALLGIALGLSLVLWALESLK